MKIIAALLFLSCTTAVWKDGSKDQPTLDTDVNSTYGQDVESFSAALSGKSHNHRPHSHSPHGHNPHYHTPRPTKYPTEYPTKYPTAKPTKYPTEYPTAYPTTKPTKSPITTTPITSSPITGSPLTVSPTSAPTEFGSHEITAGGSMTFDEVDCSESAAAVADLKAGIAATFGIDPNTVTVVTTCGSVKLDWEVVLREMKFAPMDASNQVQWSEVISIVNDMNSNTTSPAGVFNMGSYGTVSGETASGLLTLVSKCPPGASTFVKATDEGDYFWTDVADEIFATVNPDRIDNAGFYKSAGWDRRPVVAPGQDLLSSGVYYAGGETNGLTPIRFVLSDQYGNKEYCFVNVQINDEENPKIGTCPTSRTEYVGPTCTTSIAWNKPSFTDNQIAPVAITGPTGDIIGTTDESLVFSANDIGVGTYPISYTGSDLADNSIDCNFTMTVEDNTIPVFTECDATQVTYEHTCGGALGSNADVQVIWDCSSTDNCHSAPIAPDCDPWVEIVSMAGESFHATGHSRTDWVSKANVTDPTKVTDECEIMWTAYSGSADMKYCIWLQTNEIVMIQDALDSIPLSIIGGVFYYRGVNRDNFPVPPIVLDKDDTPQPTTFKVTCTATDMYDNFDTTSFTFQVQDARYKPHFTFCPSNSTIDLPSDDTIHTMVGGFRTPTWTNQGCEDTATIMTEVNGKSNETGLHAGVHAFSYKLDDNQGNVAFCNFQVTVLDKNDLAWDNCPTNQVLDTDSTLLQYAIAVWDEPSVVKRGKTMDAANVTINAPVAKSGMAFPLGQTTVEYTVTDLRAHMNETTPVTCEFVINVRDREDPTFTGKAAVPSCADGENGVPQYTMCGGSLISITKGSSFEENVAYSVAAIGPKTCCGGYTCQPFNSSYPDYVKLCM